MRIEKGRKLLLIRFSNYRQFNFIQEHKSIIETNGSVWILKAGKQIPQTKLEELFSEPAPLIMKAPKETGGQYYVALVKGAFNGLPRTDMKYPEYYSRMIDDENMWLLDSLMGSWFCAEQIAELSSDTVKHLYLLSNNKPVTDVLGRTRTATLYISTETAIEI